MDLKISIGLILTIIISLNLTKTLATTTRSHYNEVCNKTIKCQPTSWLTCLDGTCQCAKPNSMVYDPKRKKCVVKAGDTCKYSFGDVDADPGIPPRYEYLDCVENANCQVEGMCKCISTHYEDGNGTCIQRKLAHSPCDNIPGECQSELGLVCHKGICDCDPTTSMALYDKTIYFDLQAEPISPIESKFCAGLPGHSCLGSSKCSPNSSCYMKLNEEGQYNATCVCNHGLVLSKEEKTCKVNFGGTCVSSFDCHEQFQCLNSHCTCKYNSHQVFDEVTNQCRSIISAPCNSTDDCVVNSICDKSGPFNSCQCDKGYVEFGPGFCRKGHGHRCDQDQRVESPNSSPIDYLSMRKQYTVDEWAIAFMASVERQSFLTLNGHSQSRVVIEDKCDLSSRLQCRNGKCDCEDGMEAYDEEMKSCVGLVGSLCRRPSGFSTTGILVCTKNADCVGSKSKPELARCTCLEGFKATKERKCTQS